MTINQIMDVLETNGWTVWHGRDYADIGKYSPAGEDFMFSVIYKDAYELLSGICEYTREFDIDEHIKLWAMSAGENGVPSIRQLVDDAEAIAEMLDELYWALKNEERQVA